MPTDHLQPEASDQDDYQSFLVRIWRGPAGWQGEVYSLQSDKHIAFVGLRQFGAIIRRSLGQSKRGPARANEEPRST